MIPKKLVKESKRKGERKLINRSPRKKNGWFIKISGIHQAGGGWGSYAKKKSGKDCRHAKKGGKKKFSRVS